MLRKKKGSSAPIEHSFKIRALAIGEPDVTGKLGYPSVKIPRGRRFSLPAASSIDAAMRTGSARRCADPEAEIEEPDVF